MTDPLEKLAVSASELDRELLATTLADLARIDKQSGEIRFTREAAQLPKNLQLLTYLMARKAATALATALGFIFEEPISSKDLTSKLGMSGGSVRGQLSIFSKERLVANKAGKYWIPSYAIERVKALLEQASRKEK